MKVFSEYCHSNDGYLMVLTITFIHPSICQILRLRYMPKEFKLVFEAEADCFGGVSPPSPKRRADENKWKETFHNKMEVKEMTKELKGKSLLTTVLLSILLVSIAYIALMPSVHAEETTVPEKSLCILNDVAGFNLTAYTASLNTQRDTRFWTLPQKEVEFSLTSSQGNLRARCLFVNNKLHQIYISDCSGSLSLNQPSTNILDMAKSFLERYQTYTKTSFYGELRSMLNNIDISENTTKTTGDIKLEVSVFKHACVDFTWMYMSEKGVSAPSKTVVLGYHHGVLQTFLDNWQLYKIVGEPKLTSEEAVAIALKESESFSYEADVDNRTITVSGFKVVSIGKTALCYLNSVEQSSARDGAPFTLYPSWYVPLGFDRWYPGGVTGMIVRIWADTGEVSRIGPMVSGAAPPISYDMPTPEEPNLNPTVLLAGLAITIAISAAGASLSAGEKGFRSRRKPRFPRLLGALLCLLISSSVIMIALPKANAGALPKPDGKSMVYASTYGQLYEENVASSEVGDYIEYLFNAAGYNTTKFHGANMTKNNVLTWTEASEQEHLRVATFHFGHLAKPMGLAYIDSYNQTILASDISARTMGKHFFVFMWTCMAGQSPTGMASAWTQRNDLSSDGHNDPDNGLHCFIGFDGASPSLSNVTGSFNGTTVPGKDFIKKFYYYALNPTYQYSVNNALDQASSDCFNCLFNKSPLNASGFEMWWPYNPAWPNMTEPGWKPGTMRVYGNGNIRLSPQYDLTVLAMEGNNNFSGKDVYIDFTSNLANTNSAIKVTGTHTIFVNDFWESGYTWNRYTFQNYTYYGTTNTSRHLTRTFYSDYTITAHFTKAYHPGDVDGDGNADNDDWDLFCCFYPSERGDSNWNSTCDFNADGVINDGDRDHLIEKLPGVTVQAYDESSSDYVNGIPVYVNSSQAGVTGEEIHMPPGTYSIGVDGYGTFHNFTVGGNTYNNPATIQVQSGMTITANYYSLPSYDVTVNGLDYPDEQYFQTNVYIDSQYVGQTDDVFSVKLGTHSIEVDGWGGEGATFYYFDFDSVNQGYYVNPTTLPVFDDMTVTAYYIYGK